MGKTFNLTKKNSSLLIGIVVLIVCALLFGVLLSAAPTLSAKADGPTDYIEFTTEVSGETTRYIDESNIGDTVTVTYKVTHNDGINSILLIPDFDADVFEVQTVTVNEESSLGAATITVGDGTKKILLENTGEKYEALDGEEEFFLTVVYKIIAAVGGEYEFGLDVTSEGENNKSVAYFIESGEAKGEQTEVEIRVVKTNSLTLVVKQVATIEIGSNNSDQSTDGNGIVRDYYFTYKKEEVGVRRVEELSLPEVADGYYVEFTYDGDAIPVVTWYQADYEYDELEGKWFVVPTGSALGPNTLKYAGDYVVAIAAPATDRYYAVEAQYAYVHVHPLLVQITINNAESDFGDSIAALTYTADKEPFEGDSFTIDLATTATSASPVGTYSIGGEARNVVGSYTFSFTEGTYTINGKAITLTALDQTAAYTGSEPTVDQSKYTITDTASGAAYALDASVVITKQEGVIVGTYTLTPSFAIEPSGYIVTYTNGNFSITSVGADVETVKAYFEGLNKVYNGNEQDLLQVNGLPSYYYYVATNNMQTNVNDYVIGVTVNADINHNIDGEQSCYFTVDGSITPLAVTVEAVNVNVIYGQEPVIPQFSVIGTTEEVNYSYAIKNSGVAFTPAADTAVGAYDIVLTEGTNPNFSVTLTNGTYTVSKANATVNAAANDVYYNRSPNTTVSASVNTLSLTPVVTYYSDSACTQEVTPVDAGTYYAKAVVAGTANYNGAESVASFSILKVKLEGVTFSYEHGTASWSAVENDIGKTANESGVAAAALKEGATVTYKVYNGDTLIGTYNERTFDAAAASTYKVVATCSDDNYLDSESVMVAAYSVTFSEGEHLGNPTGEVSNMPATQYIFAGQTAVAPASDPEVASCTFTAWKLENSSNTYAFNEAVNGNIQIVATWDAVTYTVTLKYLPTSETEGTDMFTISGLFLNSVVSYEGLGVAPVKASDDAGIYYTFAGKWTDENSVSYDVEDSVIADFVVTEDMTFVAVFDTNYNSFQITYYLANGESTDVNAYQQVGETQTVTYGDSIEYRALVESQVAWFKIYGWYSNTDRTAALLTTMPNHDISVYAGYVFDIGVGDVNADGSVNANDITIYRQWIVGGYDVITVNAGTEWATATGENFDIANHYFLMSVADDNADLSRDIRDVSITRMAIVGSYSWDVVTDTGVTGEAIVRSAPSYNINAIMNGLNAFGRARMYQAVTAEEESISISSTGNLYIDLNGYTLTVKSLSLSTSGKDATITIANGTLIAEDGITLTAPNGNVVIEEVTAYVDGAPINLQAANSSLHFAGAVKFFNAEIIEGEISEYGVEPAPAVVHVEEGTHVVLESQAEIVIEKIIVTENNFVVPSEPSANASITLDNKTETIVEIQGNTLNEISDVAGLVAAAKNGGEYVVTADIAYQGQVCFVEDATIDLNGHTIRSVNDIALSVSKGATLTIEGEGNVMAQEACLMAFNGSTLIVNGGTYTSVDNFVVGTNGTVKTNNDMGHNVITINGGTFNGGIVSAGYVACGVYVANSDTVTVNAGTFNITNGVGFLARSGNTTVGADVIFNVTGDGHLGKVGDSKVTVPAGAVAVYDLAANYPGGDPILTFEGDYDLVAVVGSVDDINAVKGWAKEIVLGANISTDANAPIYFTQDMILNLNGKTIASSNDVALRAMNGAKLTINGNGNVNAQEGCVMAFTGSEVVINGGTYTCYDNFVIGTNGTSGYGSNVITVNGGTFNGGIQSAGYVACGIYVANSDTVTVNAGTFNITNGVGILARSGNTTIGEDVVFNVTGDGHLGKVGDSKVTVPAGAVLVYDLAANYPGGDPVLTNGTDYEIVAVVGSVDDINAVKGFAKEIVLGANITTDYNAPIYFTEDMTLNLNGKTIASTNDVALRAMSGAKLTINGNGNVNAQEGCVMAFSGSEIVINGGTYTCYDNFVIGTNGTSGYGSNVITVNGGTFNGGIQSAGYVACGIYVANSDTVTVNAGTFNTTNGVGILARSGNTTVGADVVFNVTGDGHLGKVGDSKVTVPAGEVLVLDLKANYPGGTPVLTNEGAYTVYTIEA